METKFSGILKPVLREYLDPQKLKRQDIFRPAAVTALMNEHLSGSKNRYLELWTLLIFQVWYEHWVKKL
ncbi:MAG: hypothetical protein HYT39_03065 [Candidatus Sungbacteria bacterium]|nr:hypothetical protein [Candidatus Sungbacteria bacterium]